MERYELLIETTSVHGVQKEMYNKYNDVSIRIQQFLNDKKLLFELGEIQNIEIWDTLLEMPVDVHWQETLTN